MFFLKPQKKQYDIKQTEVSFRAKWLLYIKKNKRLTVM